MKKKMSVRISSFLGKFGFWARVKFPALSSEAYLKLQFITRRKMQEKYTRYFLSQPEAPMPNVVNIETINRCNSTCAFCTACCGGGSFSGILQKAHLRR